MTRQEIGKAITEGKAEQEKSCGVGGAWLVLHIVSGEIVETSSNCAPRLYTDSTVDILAGDNCKNIGVRKIVNIQFLN